MRPAHSGFRERCTTLVLSAALAFGAPAYASSFPKKAPLAETRDAAVAQSQGKTQGKRFKSGSAECGFQNGIFTYKLPNGSVREIGPEKGMLAPDETVHDVWCNGKRAFILTNRKWIIIEGDANKQSDARASLSEIFSSMDISGIYGKGPVSWIATEDRIFLKSDKIREIPIEGDIVVHGVGLDTKDTKMILDSGLLFMAPAGGKIIVDQLGTDISARMRLPGVRENASFCKKGGKVYFGETPIDISWNRDGTLRGFNYSSP